MNFKIKVHDYYRNGSFEKQIISYTPIEEKKDLIIEPIGEIAHGPYLKDMVYENNVKEAIELILTQIRRGLRLNLLIYGTQGTGKTSTGQMLSVETKRPFIYLTGSMETKKIKHTLLNAKPQSIVLIDEIHNLTEKVANIIYPAIQDNEIYHEGNRVKLNDLMFIGTTTEPEALPRPLLDRFKLIEFEDLSLEKLQELLNHKGCDDKVINHLLNHTSNIRIINNLLDMVKIYGEINEDNLIKVFRLKKINVTSGLSDVQERYLEVLRELEKASLRTLSLQLGRSEDYIKSIETDLIKKKLINVTSKGRELI
jgi:Holliday junction resolvasome RuvABC ATP-dependent DNA helicase subunit